jgi:hypothetical protein
MVSIPLRRRCPCWLISECLRWYLVALAVGAKRAGDFGVVVRVAVGVGTEVAVIKASGGYTSAIAEGQSNPAGRMN